VLPHQVAEGGPGVERQPVGAPPDLLCPGGLGEECTVSLSGRVVKIHAAELPALVYMSAGALR
jgi:hypothetical protein